MTEISARKWVENDRKDVPHLFGFVKIIRNPENQVQIIRNPKNQVLIKVYGWQIWSTFGLKWVAVARIGLKLGGNEATRFRIIFKPDFYMKKCLVGVTLG